MKTKNKPEQYLHEHIEGGMLVRFYSDKPCVLRKDEHTDSGSSGSKADA